MAESKNDPNSPEENEAYKKKLLERANQKYAEFQKRIIRDEKEEVKSSNIITKAASYADSIISKGLSKKECSAETKNLRVLSCHGDGTENLPPCSERKNSDKFPGSFYCGACGCGDKKGTQLMNITINGEKQYSKLDYPRVSCPLKMPGFTDYQKSQSGVSNNSRKKEIENRHGVEYISQHSNP